MKKSSDGCFIAEQSWDSEDIPRRIILMNGHLDAGFMAGWHDCFQKILQIFPQFFFGHRAIRFKKFIQFCHSLRFPSGKCLSVKIFQNIGSHFLIVILYFAFFIIQCSGSVFQRMKKVRSCPVEDRHKIIGHYFYTELCKIFKCCLIIFNILIPCRKTDFDIVMDIYALYNIHVETGAFDPSSYFLYFLDSPDFPRLLVMKRPDKPADSGNLSDHFRSDVIISIAIPAKRHLHRLLPPL